MIKKFFWLFVLVVLFVSCQGTGNTPSDFEGVWACTFYTFSFSASTVAIKRISDNKEDRYSYTINSDNINLGPLSLSNTSPINGTYSFINTNTLELTLPGYNDGAKMILTRK